MATVHIAIPVQDELECLPACLDALRRQEGVRFVTWLCVNQPEAWQHEPDRRPVCEANQACLHLLADVTDLDLRIIDRSSPGRGWPPKRSGVGHARKELMDAICAEAAPRDIIVSLDADTLTPPVICDPLSSPSTGIRPPVPSPRVTTIHSPTTEPSPARF